MSVSTINSSYSGYNGHASGNWSWVMGRSGNFATNAGRLYVELSRNSGDYDEQRGYMQFDTTSIPSTATVSAVTLRCSMDWNNKDLGLGMYIVPSTMDWNSVSGVNLWSAVNLGYVSAASIPRGSIDITLSTPSVQKASYTKLMAIHAYVFFGIEPGFWDGRRDYWWISGPGETLPQLIITWTTPPAVTTGDITNIMPIKATVGGNVTDAGGGTVSERGICWNTTGTPTTSSSKASSGTGTGSYTADMTGLLPGTKYYVRTYVITENSTQYGAETSFRTPGGAILFNLL